MLLALALAATLEAAPPADLAVSGVVVRKERSTAILTSGGKTRVVAVGDQAFGGRLVTVGAEEVRMDFGGRSVVLRLPSERQVAARAPVPPPAAAAPAPSVSPGGPPEDSATPARTMQRAEVQ